MQHEELTVLKESSISALGSLADAERDMSTLKRNVAETHAEYVKQVNKYQAQLAKEREMTAAIEQQLRNLSGTQRSFAAAQRVTKLKSPDKKGPLRIDFSNGVAAVETLAGIVEECDLQLL